MCRRKGLKANAGMRKGELEGWRKRKMRESEREREGKRKKRDESNSKK